MSHFLPAFRSPAWFQQDMPFYKPEGRIYTPGRARESFYTYIRYELSGDLKIIECEVYETTDRSGTHYQVQIYCPSEVCAPYQQIGAKAMPELTLRNKTTGLVEDDGPNPKNITFSKTTWTDLAAGEVNVMTVDELIACPVCLWTVKITNGIAKLNNKKLSRF